MIVPFELAGVPLVFVCDKFVILKVASDAKVALCVKEPSESKTWTKNVEGAVIVSCISIGTAWFGGFNSIVTAPAGCSTLLALITNDCEFSLP